jgi:hypothetical protein
MNNDHDVFRLVTDSFDKSMKKRMRKGLLNHSGLLTLFLISALSVLVLNACAAGTEEDTGLPTIAATAAAADETTGIGATVAFEAVLAFVNERYGETAPSADLLWTTENITPEGLVGSTTFQYTAETCEAYVSYTIAPLDSIIYNVSITDNATGFNWLGSVDAAGKVNEQYAPLVDAEGEYCVDTSTGARLSYAEAAAIAEGSECGQQGQLEATRICNQDTGTWWIDLDMDMPGCNPACVVDLNTATAEINGRCTGVLPPADEEQPTPGPVAPIVDDISVPYDYSGWQAYTNEEFGYTLMYPGDAAVIGANLDEMVQFVGSEHWPILTVDHGNSDFFHPPAGTDVRQWVLDLYTAYDSIGPEMTIAGLPTVHLVYESGPGWEASDEYFFIRDQQLFRILILHSEGRQDWDLYNQFLYSITFDDEYESTGSTVEGWTGTIGRFPFGSQYKYYFERADEQQLIVGAAVEAMNEQIENVAWTGAQVELWGQLGPEMPNHINVTRLGIVSEPSIAARNLSPFATPRASSVLPSDRLGTYHEWSAINGLLESPWCEGADGSGVGQWLMLEFLAPLEVAYISIDVGYDHNDDIFFKNNRIKKARLIFSDGTELPWEFEDERGLQLVPLACAPGPCMQTTLVKLVIDEVYPGTLYDDACIAEIEVWGMPG